MELLSWQNREQVSPETFLNGVETGELIAEIHFPYRALLIQELYELPTKRYVVREVELRTDTGHITERMALLNWRRRASHIYTGDISANRPPTSGFVREASPDDKQRYKRIAGSLLRATTES